MRSYVDVFDGRVHYQKRGEGPHVVICLHGNSSSASAFWSLTDSLLEGRTVYLIDFPGHGFSDGSAAFKRYYSFQGLKAILLAVIHGLGVEPQTIIGHSMGGHIAAQVMADIASLRSLVLISSPPIAGADGMKQFFKETAPIGSIFSQDLTPAEIATLARDFTTDHFDAPGRAALEANIAATDGVFRSELGRSLSGADIVDELQIISKHRHIDLLLIGGADDKFIRSTYFDWVGKQLRLDDQHVTVIPSVGHYPHLEATTETAEKIAAFFNSSGGT